MNTVFDVAIIGAGAVGCAIAHELSCTPSQLALAWCLLRPEVTSVITGATRAEQITS